MALLCRKATWMAIVCTFVTGWSGRAAAQEEPVESEFVMDVALGFRGVGEIWQDTNIAHHYRSSRYAGTGFGSVGVAPWLSGEFEIGYMRQSANTQNIGVAEGALEIVPVTLSANLRYPTAGGGELFGGLGYAMTVFTETTTGGTVSGIKPGFELRSGVRIQTDLVQPSMWHGDTGGVRGIDVEFLFARRQHMLKHEGEGEERQSVGLDFSAWRVGIGLVARL